MCCGNIKNILEGLGKLALRMSEKLSAKRMAICTPCEFRRGARCPECKTDLIKKGCFLSAKTRVVEEVCPKGKW